MSHLQVNIFIIFITFLSADVAIMMMMWDKATSNQGGRGLALSYQYNVFTRLYTKTIVIYTCNANMIVSVQTRQ